MQGKKRMTRHAWDRWLERFDAYDLDAEMAAAIPWGGQRHGDQSWLAPCGAVFIVSGGNVRTVLTKTQAMANMQQFVRGALLDELPVARSQPAVATGMNQKKNSVQPNFSNSQLTTLPGVYRGKGSRLRPNCEPPASTLRFPSSGSST